MRVTFNCLLLGLVLALTGCSSVSNLLSLSEPSDSYTRTGYDFSQVDTVAIVDVVGDIESEVVKNQISEYFTAHLLKKGFAPIERHRVQGLLSQTNISRDQVHPELYAVEAGHALQMPVVMLISIPSFGDEISITAKLIEVDSGSALWLGRASKGFGKRGRRRSRDFTDEGFGDNFSASLYDYPGMGLGQSPDPMQAEPMLTALTLKEESRISGMIESICKTLPKKNGKRGLGGALLGLIDDRPARTPEAPAPRVREELQQPASPTPLEAESLVVREPEPQPVQLEPSVPQREPVRVPLQTPPSPVVREPVRRPLQVTAPLQDIPSVSDQELRTISPGTPAPIQRRPTSVEPQTPQSIFEKGFADAMARQPVYITDKSSPRLTPPLEPRPQYPPERQGQYVPQSQPQYLPQRQPQRVPTTLQPQAQVMPERQPEPVRTRTVWRQPVKTRSESEPEPRARSSKRSFWRNLLGLD